MMPPSIRPFTHAALPSARTTPRRSAGGTSAAIASALLLAAALFAMHPPRTAVAEPGDAHAGLPRAPHGTRFSFEIIESHDAKYLGDTPGHMGRDGGLEFRPNVALGDPVYRSPPASGNRAGDDRVVGRITAVTWERVSGGLTIEFDPEPLVRIAVGDEVWIDLNPTPPPAAALPAAAAPPAAR